MSDMWKKWEGQVIDHKYQLRRFLGSTDHSAVFYAEYRDPEPHKAAVKFLAADLPHSEAVLADWKQAQQVSHPSLLPIYSVGRCQVEEMDVIYAAMEYADENLAEILPHRALTADEMREVLKVAVNVLLYLHGKKLTHGHIKPSNIMAVGDHLKLSSDTIQPLAEAREMRRKRDAYDAPEIPASAYAPAADIWSLGVTLVEALTQQPAILPYNENVEPVIAPSVREPFREIATHALRRDPKARWNSMDIALLVNPQAVEAAKAAMTATAGAAAASSTTASSAAPAVAVAAASAVAPPPSGPSPAPVVQSAAAPAVAAPKPLAAAAAVSPLSVPLSKEPAVPLAKQPVVKTVAPRPPMPPPPVARPAAKPASKTVTLPNYVVPLIVIVLIVLAAIFVLPKIMRRSTQPTTEKETTLGATTPNADKASSSTAAPAAKEPVKPAPTSAPPVKPSTSSAASSAPPVSAADTSTPAPHTTEPTPVATPKKTTAAPDRGEVLDKVLPRPASAALATIQGTVRVVVRVHVDAAGNVSQALLEKPGPSKYFAQQSLEAARGWVFSSPTVNGHSEESEWLIRFEFRSSDVNAYPSPAKP